MCGRDYSTFTDEELFFRYFNKRGWLWAVDEKIPSVAPSFNKCPTQKSAILAVKDNTLAFHEMRWGLVPAWASTVKDADKYSMINAKSEEIAEKRSYKAAFQKRRCIVPVSGFFEWKQNEKPKRPFAIKLKDNSIMSLAGIWERWISKVDGEVVDSFAIVTTSPNSLMAEIHNRMPVILPVSLEEKWLDPETKTEELAAVMVPFQPDLMEAFEISTLVNSPKNNSSEVLRPLK